MSIIGAYGLAAFLAAAVFASACIFHSVRQGNLGFALIQTACLVLILGAAIYTVSFGF